MTPTELDALVALGEGITPGPWLDAVSDTHDGRLAIWADGGMAGVTQIAVLPPEFKAVKANARAIAAVPELIAAITTLRKSEDELREWALDKSALHHRLAHENEPLRTEHIASSTAYRNLAEELAHKALSNTEGGV